MIVTTRTISAQRFLPLLSRRVRMSTAAKTAPMGKWESPITAASIVEGTVSLRDVLVDPITSEIYHVEARPSEKREVLVATKDYRDIVPSSSEHSPWNVRTGVQEYGGAASIVHNGDAYFSNFSDGRVYKVNAKESKSIPEAITPESKVLRFANFEVHPRHRNLIVSVQEDHTDDKPSTVVNTLVIINAETQAVTPLVSGADFYADPKFSPDGLRLAWQQHFHPSMPWEAAEIHIADVTIENDKLTLQNSRHIAGERLKVSVGYPSWVDNSTLLFTSDISGYQNPWKYSVKDGKASPILAKPMLLDFCGPAWLLGFSPYAIVSDGKSAVFTVTKDGRNSLLQVDIQDGQTADIVSPYVNIPAVRAVSATEIVLVAQTAVESPTVVLVTLSPTLTYKVIKPPSSSVKFAESIISLPKPISFKVGENGKPLHVVYYAPTNPEYSVEAHEKPPCIINVHGGPTTLTGQGLEWTKQFFTSRGFAWCDVNYGGSSGYGREYTDRLVGNWGIVDVADCILAAQTLSGPSYNLADPKRMLIRGGSAGGYTVLASLSIANDVTVFAAGTSNYGISDFKKLGEDTHKFESRYLYKLIGGTYQEVPEIYEARSPVMHADKIVSPLLILQGDIDRVVPKEQAEVIYKSIQKRGGVVEYKLYEGEGHGWRQAENIKDSLERELAFYQRVLKL